MAKEAVAVSTIPPTPYAYTAEELALRLHFLGATAHGRRLFPSSYRIPQENNNRVTLSDKSMSVVRALATSCTPGPGKDNVALVVGIKPAEIHVFVCGKDSDATVSHINAIWKLLQKIHTSANVARASPSLSSPPHVMRSEEPCTKELYELVYSFVRHKVLHRAAKRFDVVTEIAKIIKPHNAIEKMLLTALLALVKLARDALPHRNDTDFAANKNWLDFRKYVGLLSTMTKERDYGITVARVQKRIDDSYFKFFDVEKSVAKITKVDTALLTLYALAVSPRRGEFVKKQLTVHYIAIPKRSTIDIDVRSIPNSWSEDRELAIQKMQDGSICVDDSVVRLHTKVHSECHIVAWLAQNLTQTPRLADLILIPYVTCSKLHCFGCFTWLSAFNELCHPGLPTICFDGTHGKLHPGWTPPSLDTFDQRMRNSLVMKMEVQFPKTHYDEESASSTTSGSQPIQRPRSEMDKLRIEVAEKFPLQPGLPAFDLAGDSSGSTLDGVARKKRKLEKALKAISNLKAKRGRGESLEIEQQDKIKKEEQIQRELESLSI
ncbi:hypothetical protein GGX14DRAFT_386635 [Mycena pura]|uniref:Uncharacterized protein n=1 Tax=Mycena pura TaxID=153505 RepID=A0AAD6YQ24_9AGAR|nr:hypothetical protein GGX14DRAFT_386635 [Mycena pura]